MLRDVKTEDIAMTPVQRRYELEAAIRPFGTEALEVGAGGRIGETRHDFDGWGRVSFRAARGFYVHAAVESRALQIVDTTSTGVIDSNGRDLRATLGLGVSVRRARRHGTDRPARASAATATCSARRRDASVAVAPPSVLGPVDHIERVELSGIGLRDWRRSSFGFARSRAIDAKALVVMFDGAAGGGAGLEELRDEITRVRKAGKKVFAYMVSGTGRDYFIATAADKIYIDPAGGVRLVGMAGTTIYFRGILDTLGVSPQFGRSPSSRARPSSSPRPARPTPWRRCTTSVRLAAGPVAHRGRRRAPLRATIKAPRRRRSVHVATSEEHEARRRGRTPDKVSGS